jgi:hypothetical protein
VKDRFGHTQVYLLADRRVRVYYDRRRRYFQCRQVTRLDPATGHQTQIVTTRCDLSAPEVAQTMFGRWREENLFRFMRPPGLEAMDSYAKTADDPKRMVPNPAKAHMKTRLAVARAAVAAATLNVSARSRLARRSFASQATRSRGATRPRFASRGRERRRASAICWAMSGKYRGRGPGRGRPTTPTGLLFCRHPTPSRR